MSNSAFEPVVEGLTVQAVPQLRAAALMAPGAVQTSAPVLAGRRQAVVNGVEFTMVSGRPRLTRTVERLRSWHAGGTVLARRTVAVGVSKLATLS